MANEQFDENNLKSEGWNETVARAWGVHVGSRRAAFQSDGDICSSSSEELKPPYLHTKGFATD